MKCLRPLKRWNRVFESHSRHGLLSMFLLCLCCPVYVTALRQGWSPVRRVLPAVYKSYSSRLILMGNRPEDLKWKVQEEEGRQRNRFRSISTIVKTVITWNILTCDGLYVRNPCSQLWTQRSGFTCLPSVQLCSWGKRRQEWNLSPIRIRGGRSESKAFWLCRACKWNGKVRLQQPSEMQYNVGQREGARLEMNTGKLSTCSYLVRVMQSKITIKTALKTLEIKRSAGSKGKVVPVLNYLSMKAYGGWMYRSTFPWSPH
jgi:hypothetical protein